MGPADIAAMIHLIRSTTPDKEASSGLKKGIKALVSTVNASTAGAGSAVDQHKSQAVFERVYFSNRHVSDACVVLVSTRAPVGAIKHLDLSNTDNITGEALVALCEEHGESVESLVLTITPKINLNDILQSVSLCYAEGFGNLQKLQLDDIKDLQDKMLSKMATKLCKQLTSLSLRYALNVKDQGIIDIAKTHTKLLHLDVSGCEKLTDKSIIYVAHACVELQALNTTGIMNITDESMLQFAYRGRRYYTGRKGLVTKGPFNHDDPTLVLADLVLKNRGKNKKTDDEDDEWVFDDDVALSEDAAAMAAFEAERERKERVKQLKREIREQEFARTLKAARLTMEQVQAIFRKEGEEPGDGGEMLLDLDEIAIKMGLEEPAARERRLLELERAKEAQEEKEALKQCEEMVSRGLRPWQIARELKLDREVVHYIYIYRYIDR